MIKPLFKSRTVWSAVLTCIGKLVAEYMKMPELADQIVTVGMTIAGIFLRESINEIQK